LTFDGNACNGGPLPLSIASGTTLRLSADIDLNNLSNTDHSVILDGTLDLAGHAMRGITKLTIGASGQVLNNGGTISSGSCTATPPAVCP
jgi:hypothetical protein